MFPLCVTGGTEREVLSRTRALQCFGLHSSVWGEKGKRRRRSRDLGLLCFRIIQLEFMEAAVVENEDLLCGLRSLDSFAAQR